MTLYNKMNVINLLFMLYGGQLKHSWGGGHNSFYPIVVPHIYQLNFFKKFSKHFLNFINFVYKTLGSLPSFRFVSF